MAGEANLRAILTGLVRVIGSTRAAHDALSFIEYVGCIKARKTG